MLTYLGCIQCEGACVHHIKIQLSNTFSLHLSISHIFPPSLLTKGKHFVTSKLYMAEQCYQNEKHSHILAKTRNDKQKSTKYCQYTLCNKVALSEAKGQAAVTFLLRKETTSKNRKRYCQSECMLEHLILEN